MNTKAAKQLLDRGDWKHSRHLPRTESGNYDWFHPKSIAMVREEIRLARREAALLFRMCRAVDMDDADIDNALMEQSSSCMEGE